MPRDRDHNKPLPESRDLKWSEAPGNGMGYSEQINLSFSRTPGQINGGRKV